MVLNKSIIKCIHEHYKFKNIDKDITGTEHKLMYTSEKLRNTYIVDYKIKATKDNDMKCVVIALDKVVLEHVRNKRSV